MLNYISSYSIIYYVDYDLYCLGVINMCEVVYVITKDSRDWPDEIICGYQVYKNKEDAEKEAQYMSDVEHGNFNVRELEVW